jgi:hypothetical protein
MATKSLDPMGPQVLLGVPTRRQASVATAEMGGLRRSEDTLELPAPGPLRRADAPASRLGAPAPAPCSTKPLLRAGLAAGGKLVSAMGAAGFVRAHYSGSVGDQAAGGALLGAGLTASLAAAWWFGRDAHAVWPQAAWRLKGISVSAALLLATGSALHQLGVSRDDARLAWAACLPILAGYAAVWYALPRFFACSERRHGLAFAQHRTQAQAGLEAVGLVVLASWPSTSAGSHVPPFVGPAMVTVGFTPLVMSMAMTRSDRLRPQLAPPAAPLASAEQAGSELQGVPLERC